MPLSFEEMPKKVEQIWEALEAIQKLLEKLQPADVNAEVWFDLKQLCNYLPDKPARATIYAYVSAGKIPYHKSGKKLRFLKASIDAWLLEGKSKSHAVLTSQTDLFLSSVKRKGGRHV